jgi:hypothetical protein
MERGAGSAEQGAESVERGAKSEELGAKSKGSKDGAKSQNGEQIRLAFSLLVFSSFHLLQPQTFPARVWMKGSKSPRKRCQRSIWS